jgi:hypothetical protein
MSNNITLAVSVNVIVNSFQTLSIGVDFRKLGVQI